MMAAKLRSFWFRWAPVLACMLVIFYFSSQPYHKQDLRPRLHSVISEQFVVDHFSHVTIRYGHEIVSVAKNGPMGFIEFFIRKGAHLTIYASLGALLARAIRRRAVITIAVVGILCFAYAGSDEFHQYITGDRTPMFEDVLLDTFGALSGGLLYYLIRRIRPIKPATK